MKILVLNRAAERVENTWDGVVKVSSAQWCTLEIDGLPTAFQVKNDPGKELAPGEYELDARSFSVTNGRLTVNRVVLRPVAVSQTKPVPKAA